MADLIRAKRKPLEFDVMHFDGTEEDLLAVNSWIQVSGKMSMVSTSPDYEGLWIMGPGGTQYAVKGDYVVKNMDGNFGVLTSDSFVQLYDLV